ncbi:hypothetical protein ACIOUE_37775 [Streptomyces xanthochromogenes]|uniref:hypothetical protein n=1 Tax=Streptomyces xanthochromogenes TaxID=67384 RepID=UPI00382C6E75
MTTTTGRSRKAWNQGKTGIGRAAADTPVIERCPVEGCGSESTGPAPAKNMVKVRLPRSSEPARWYCPGRCRAIGQALAELRAIPVPAHTRGTAARKLLSRRSA